MTSISSSQAYKTSFGSVRGGTQRYLAPEMASPDRFGTLGDLTRMTDVFAFGMTFYEVNAPLVAQVTNIHVFLKVLARKAPFYPRTDAQALVAIGRGDRPGKLAGVDDIVWAVIVACWRHQPSLRLTFTQILQKVRATI